jgi:enoyl-CoA hydratase/carnithine racemase
VTGSVTVDDVGPVRVLMIDHPEKRNALDDATRRSLRQRLAEVAEAAHVRVVVLTGAAGTFCAGGELASMPSEVAAIDRRMGELHDITRAIAEGPVPVIAAIEGFAFGSGLSIAAASDRVVAARDARFCASFGRVGLVGDVGIARSLVRRVGVGPATEILLWADELTAERAASIGLVDELVEPDSALDAAMASARRLAERAPLAVAAARRLVRAADLPLDDFLAAELVEQRALLGTADFHEGREAFFAKRRASFEGR